MAAPKIPQLTTRAIVSIDIDIEQAWNDLMEQGWKNIERLEKEMNKK